MSYALVESSLRNVSKSLDLVAARREKLIKESRDIVSLSAKTIVYVHTGEIDVARKVSEEARGKLKELRKVAGTDLTRYIMMPEQEYVESMVMLAIKGKKNMPSIKDLKVTSVSYILGLLDAIGELKRSLYDDIRRNEIANADEKFAIMESLYTLLSPFALYDNIIQGVRRKLDVARILIEDARAAITEESRRTEFMQAVSTLSARLGLASTPPASFSSNAKTWKNKRRGKIFQSPEEEGQDAPSQDPPQKESGPEI